MWGRESKYRGSLFQGSEEASAGTKSRASHCYKRQPQLSLETSALASQLRGYTMDEAQFPTATFFLQQEHRLCPCLTPSGSFGVNPKSQAQIPRQARVWKTGYKDRQGETHTRTDFDVQ